MTAVKLRQAGGSISATLPHEFTKELHLEVGDTVYTSVENGRIIMTPRNPKTEAVLAAGRETLREYREALHELSGK
ncbi:MAG: AbrB/MazE/SpoVT family DNA-binding domain-containing protein [Coriobacteriia bacterium]|nr:AbrB/MazE/SpoVT family DNA-binding domain-containing protein [Coriobacteriia bacterium]